MHAALVAHVDLFVHASYHTHVNLLSDKTVVNFENSSEDFSYIKGEVH